MLASTDSRLTIMESKGQDLLHSQYSAIAERQFPSVFAEEVDEEDAIMTLVREETTCASKPSSRCKGAGWIHSSKSTVSDIIPKELDFSLNCKFRKNNKARLGNRNRQVASSLL
ncbi:hypothetical protein K7X08_030622 [Anisodus acutangulus]|uniref:Uncharacterized protein n=1 Tax=Anisodus acutangulus TaxID=402998 RepID=A0A9Q1QXD6_9SOLA|nr:hypothetical protein K7X08_030622 [Anisodus acutangulus]